MQLYTKLEVRNYCRKEFRAFVLAGYPHHFEQGNGAHLLLQLWLSLEY